MDDVKLDKIITMLNAISKALSVKHSIDRCSDRQLNDAIYAIRKLLSIGVDRQIVNDNLANYGVGSVASLNKTDINEFTKNIININLKLENDKTKQYHS